MNFKSYFSICILFAMLHQPLFANSDVTTQFLICASHNDIQCMKDMVAQGADYTASTASGFTALHLITHNGARDLEMLKYMLSLDLPFSYLAQLPASKFNRRTALTSIIIFSDGIKSLEILLEAAEERALELINQPTGHNLSALEVVARSGKSRNSKASFLTKMLSNDPTLISYPKTTRKSAFEIALGRDDLSLVFIIFANLSKDLKIQAIEHCYDIAVAENDHRCDLLKQNIENKSDTTTDNYL